MTLVAPADTDSAPAAPPREPDDTVRVLGRRIPGPLLMCGPAVLPALLMLAVGRIGLRRPAVGWDENATWLASGRSVGQLVDLARHFDGVISPYYLFMHFWTGVFGDSELALRAPSLIAVTLGVGVSAELGRRLFGPATGLLTGLLLVTVPQLSRYAQDARAYGIAFLLATLATLLLYRALREPTWARWILYGVTVTLLGLAHILALLVLIGHAYAVLTRARRDAPGTRPLRWLVVTAVALLPVLPFVYLGLTQRGSQLDWLPPMTLRQVMTAPGDIFGVAAVGLLLIGLALTARHRDGRPLRELAVLAVAPPAALIGVSFVTSPLWVPRYVLVVVPAICLCAAVALRAVPLRAVAALVLLVGVGWPAQQRVRSQTSHLGPDFRTVGRYLERHQQPGDVIVYGTAGTWSLRAGVDYQLRGRQKPRDVLLLTPAAEVGELDAVQCPDPVACLGSAPRVWLFRWQPVGKELTSTAPLADTGAVGPVLTADYRVAGVWRATKANLILFARR
ncbi:glycosyltransferase family 39 protein [Actinoplanes sp. NPDC049599]|uniref:glycosyltransferase family 39 protein n=1 Tax=Actinoplanes sp. NPDC049599 TaxID=3363903 RepID=UPI0037A0AEB4